MWFANGPLNEDVKLKLCRDTRVGDPQERNLQKKEMVDLSPAIQRYPDH